MASYDPQVLSLIINTARKYNMDPRAVVAVAMGEGGLSWGAVGDNGTSFGPFQLHIGGALPRGRGPEWANSPAGVDYAIRKMAEYGAAGLTGPAAINSIVRKFERPAAPDASVRNAVGRYQGNEIPSFKGLPPPSTAAPTTTPGSPVNPTTGLPTSTKLNAPDPKATALSILGDLALGKPFKPLEFVLGQAQQKRQAEILASMMPTAAPSSVTVPGTTPTPSATEPTAPTGQGIPAADTRAWSKLKGIAATSPDFMLTAIQKAQEMGLRVGENPYIDPVDPVHVEGSFHDQRFGGQYGGKGPLGRAIDVSGDPKAMAAFFRWAIQYRPTELFYDPLGQFDNGRYSTRGIGNHDDHVHLSV